MSDLELRAIERRAAAGDTSAMVEAAHRLGREGRPGDALAWLELALAAREPTAAAALDRFLPEAVASDDAPALARLARAGVGAARAAILEHHGHLAAVMGTAVERRVTSDLIGGAMPSLRPIADLDTAIANVLAAGADVQLAGLLLAFDRLVVMQRQQTVPYTWYQHQAAIKGLASRVLRRKREWQHRDLVGLLLALADAVVFDHLPWAGLMRVVEHVTPDARLFAAVRIAWQACLAGIYAASAGEARFQMRAKAYLDREQRG